MVNAFLKQALGASRQRCCSDVPLILEGVRTKRLSLARSIVRDLAMRGEVAYRVSETKCGQRNRKEQRADARERPRLRSAKLLDASYRFVCECRICDRSANGLKLMLVSNIRLPAQFAIHIDETSEVRRGRVMWRRGAMLGVRLYGAAPRGALSLSDRFALRERYYAIPD